MNVPRFPGLEYSFLEYFDVTSENQRPIQKRYVPFFEDSKQVVDLGCGTGDFLELLEEAGIEALGVDSDPKCCDVVRRRGLEVVEVDALTYLLRSDSESVDGVFSAHLVEHLPFESVLTILEQCYRVLRPGGRIVIVTPNVRSLYAHLDMFYLHFGHVYFYHQELLEFFLDYVGFESISVGENEMYPYPLLQDALLEKSLQVSPRSSGDMSVEAVLPKPKGLLRRCWWHVKVFGITMIVKPYIDALGSKLSQLSQAYDVLTEQHNLLIDRIDRPFEAFVVADKL